MVATMVWLLVTLSVTGFVISSYFTGAAYHRITPDTRWIPAVCRMDAQTCAAVVFARQARVFGVPNSLLGQVFYAAVAVAAGVGGLEHAVARVALTAASGGTVLLGLYLTWSLVVVLRVHCPLCYTAHVINLALFVTLLSAG